MILLDIAINIFNFYQNLVLYFYISNPMGQLVLFGMWYFMVYTFFILRPRALKVAYIFYQFSS